MPGLLDYFSAPNNGAGVGGLLSYINSPLYMSPAPPPDPQPQYDAMGNVSIPAFLSPPDPFGPVPQFKAPEAPSVFSTGTPAVAGFPSFGPQGPAPQPVMPQATAQAPQLPPPVNVPPAPQPAASQIASAPQPATDLSAQNRQPSLADAATGNLPAALGGGTDGFFDRLNAGLQSVGRGGSLIGALTGNYTDRQSIGRQALKAQYDALVPVVGPQKAMLAVLNPEAGKTILAQALEKKQFGFTKLDNDTIVANDPQTGRSVVSYGGGGSVNTVTGPDGKPIPIPPGVDPKTFRNEISRATADAATGKKTEVQAAAEQFANRMESAEKSFSRVGAEGLGLSGATQSITGAVPVVGNFMKTENYQKMEQAKREWVTALLRKESGAAIGRDEYTQYDRQFFPQPGDGPDVVAQKAAARRVATEALKKSAGPSYRPPAESGAVRKYNPATGRIE